MPIDGVCILSVSSTNQDGGLWRYVAKLQVPSAAGCDSSSLARPANLVRMLKRDKRLDCHVKINRPPPNPTITQHVVVRKPRRRARGRLPPPPQLSAWPVVSLNIRGTGGVKRDRLQWLLDSEIPGVVCLQETLRPVDGWRLRLAGYAVMECARDDDIVGARGVALAVHRQYSVRPLGFSPHWCAGFVSAQNTPALIVASVYLPSNVRVMQLNKLMRDLRKQVAKWRSRHADCPVVLSGDWNMTSAKLTTRLGRWNMRAMVVPVDGDNRTYHIKGRATSAIDHMVWVPPAAQSHNVGFEGWDLAGPAHVANKYDLSDHWPLFGYLNASPNGSQSSRAVVPERVVDGPCASVRARIQLPSNPPADTMAAIASHNRFTALLSPEVEPDVSKLAQATVDACHAAASDVGLVKKALARDRKRKRWSKALRKASSVQRDLYQALKQMPAASEERDNCYLSYTAARSKVRKLHKQWSHTQWIQYVVKGAGTAARRSPKEYWRWVQRMLQCRFVGGDVNTKQLTACAVVDPDTGELVSDAEHVKQLWAQHFGRLAADSLANSKDTEHWKRALRWFPQSGQLDSCLNDTIQWHEVSSVLCSMRRGKATGDDAIPSEFWKCAVEVNDDGEVPKEPTTPLGRCLLLLLNRIWEQGTIPDVWQRAVIVAVPKKGDLSVMGNYRGISLINTGLKVLASIVNTRITSQLEGRGAFSRAQAGCRHREEAPAQAVGLYETIQRRTQQGKTTLAVFIDLKKAFDTVPHAGMITKLCKYGVSGRALAFIQALYDSSSFRVRTAAGLSDETDLLRGVRQGCNLSPLLFNLYVNDLFDTSHPTRGHFPPGMSSLNKVGCCERGVGVAGYAYDRVDGFMFVDDIVGLAESLLALAQLLRDFGSWFTKHAMAVGHRKCGIMVFGPDSGRDSLKHQLQNHPDMRMVQGSPIEVVSEYVYLGCKFTDTLDLGAMAEARAVIAKKALFGMSHFLSTRAIPLDTRVMVYRSVVVASAAYGSELWGMNRHRSASGARLQNQAIRLMLGSKMNSYASVPLATAHKELGIPPFHAITAQRRARAFVKYHHVSTQISGFLSGKAVLDEDGKEIWQVSTVPAGCRRKSWVRRSMLWLKGSDGLGAGCLTNCTLMNDVSGSAMAEMVLKKAVDDAWVASVAKAKSARAYDTLELVATRGWMEGWIARPDLATGWTQLLRMRTGAFLHARRLAYMKVLPERFLDQCPFCRGEIADSNLHYLLQCNRWATERDELLEPVLSKLRIALAAQGDTGASTLYHTLIGCSAHCAQFASEDDSQGLSWAVSAVPNPTEETHDARSDTTCSVVSLCVAQFLSATIPIRWRVLGAFLQEPRPNPGRAAINV